MRVLGKRSIASFLKFMMDFTWWFVIVVFSGMLILFTWQFFLSGPSYEIHGWPVYFEPTVQSCGIYPKDGDISVLEVEVEEGRIGFEAMGDWQPKAIRLISLLVGGWMALSIIHYLRRIIASVKDENPFIRENVARFRKIAFLFLGIVAFDAVRETLIAVYIHSRFVIENPDNPFRPLDLGAWGDFLRSIDGSSIFIALVMLVLGEIFRLGLVYKEDSHSII